MSRFRKVDVRVWNDERFRPFSDDAKLVFLFILTHPHLTALGAMRGTLDGLAAELGWSPKRFRAAIAPATVAGMIEVNNTAAYIGLPNFLRYNEPEGPNSVKKAWVTALDSIPECPEKRTLILRCRKYLDGKSRDFKTSLGEAIWEAFADAMPDAIGDGYRDASPIQEQEQEQEPSPLPPKGVRRSLSSHPWPGFEEFWVAYPRKTARAAALKAWSSLRPVEALRAELLRALEAQCQWPEWIRDGGQYIPHPDKWLRGRRWEDRPLEPAGHSRPSARDPLSGRKEWTS